MLNRIEGNFTKMENKADINIVVTENWLTAELLYTKVSVPIQTE